MELHERDERESIDEKNVVDAAEIAGRPKRRGPLPKQKGKAAKVVQIHKKVDVTPAKAAKPVKQKRAKRTVATPKPVAVADPPKPKPKKVRRPRSVSQSPVRGIALTSDVKRVEKHLASLDKRLKKVASYTLHLAKLHIKFATTHAKFANSLR